jgi:hypothetical protein
MWAAFDRTLIRLRASFSKLKTNTAFGGYDHSLFGPTGIQYQPWPQMEVAQPDKIKPRTLNSLSIRPPA